LFFYYLKQNRIYSNLSLFQFVSVVFRPRVPLRGLPLWRTSLSVPAEGSASVPRLQVMLSQEMRQNSLLEVRQDEEQMTKKWGRLSSFNSSFEKPAN
jgi:hypothetical protein